MAQEAFALSPISAQPASPTDADFEAIREAFLETARGRWFLDEYTRRNRNADTAMVLEAVARIESSLAAQKEEQQRQASSESPPVEPPSSELPEAMAAVQAIVAAARESALAALADGVLDEALAPSRKCARVIREIAWGLRESGADGRICALLDSQVDAINAACDHMAFSGARDRVLQAFDQAAQQIGEITGSGTAARSEFSAPTPPADLTPASLPPVEETQSVILDDEPFDTAAVVGIPQPEAIVETVLLAEEGQLAELASFVVEAEAADTPAITAHLHVVPDVQPEPVTDVVLEAIATMDADETSLGASLIANGIIAKPASPRSDPLAAIRRMSLAEKVAFFS